LLQLQYEYAYPVMGFCYGTNYIGYIQLLYNIIYSRKFIVAIPMRKPLIEGLLLNWAKDLFRWGARAIMTGCSS